MIPHPDTWNGGKVVTRGETPPPAKTKATGSKSVPINVHIAKLIGIENKNSTTTKESMASFRDAVVRTLTDATNHFQVVVDQ